MTDLGSNQLAINNAKLGTQFVSDSWQLSIICWYLPYRPNVAVLNLKWSYNDFNEALTLRSGSHYLELRKLENNLVPLLLTWKLAPMGGTWWAKYLLQSRVLLMMDFSARNSRVLLVISLSLRPCRIQLKVSPAKVSNLDSPSRNIFLSSKREFMDE